MGVGVVHIGDGLGGFKTASLRVRMVGRKDALALAAAPSDSGATCVRIAALRDGRDSHPRFGKFLPTFGGDLMWIKPGWRAGLAVPAKPS
jgi:hypothetical protein